jgi:hypothetical protein
MDKSTIMTIILLSYLAISLIGLYVLGSGD